MKLTAAGLWVVALAVCLLVNPYAGEHQRLWESTIFMWGGIWLGSLILSDSWTMRAMVTWLFISAAYLHRSPAAVSFMIYLLGGLGIYRVGRDNKTEKLIIAMTALLAFCIFLQVTHLYQPIAVWIFPSYTREIYNQGRSLTGFTGSTGDAGVILAMGLPFLLRRDLWPLFAGTFLALLATQATSAIIGGSMGCLVGSWPYAVTFHKKLRAMGQGVPTIVYTMTAAFLTLGLNHLDGLWAALTDMRWTVWWEGTKRLTLSGHGLGSWQTKFPLIYEGGDKYQHWQQAHFDLLQFAFEAGTIGLILASMVIVESAKSARSRYALGGLVAFLFSQFGHFPIHIGAGGLMSCLVLAQCRGGTE